MKTRAAGRCSRGVGCAVFLGTALSAAVPGGTALGAGAPPAEPVAGEPVSAEAVQGKTAPLAQAERQYSFEIAPQALDKALEELGRQAEVQISARSELLAGRTSGAVQGSMTLEEGLRRLLQGSGLSYLISESGVAVVEAEGSASDAPILLPPIILTGEKIERSYRDTFTSTGLATEADIEDQKLDELDDVFNTLANVRLFPTNNGNNGFQIRGLNADGVTQPSNSAPLISVIIDGVTQSAEGLKRGSRGTWDVKQVEVLRGPQSTLQGRNALAGAVVVETNDPTYDFEAAARGVAGNLDRRDGAFMVSGPIIADQVAFRIAGEFREQEKDITFVDPDNEEMADDKYRTVRGKLLFEPEALDDLSVFLSLSRTFDQPTSAVVTGPDFFDRVFASAASFTEIREMDVDNVGLDVSYDLTDALTLRSVSALNRTDLSLQSVPGSAPGFVRDDHREDKDFMQDLRLEISENDSSIEGVIGLFYGDFEQEIDTFISVSGTVFQEGIFRRETESRAVYADLRYRVNDWFSVLGGGRYQWDTVSNFSDIDSFFGPSNSDLEEDFRVFLPKAGVAFDLDESQTLAFTATRGYRQGFSNDETGASGGINVVDPEFLWSYEAAYRYVPAPNLTLGANLFYSRYSDQQVAIPDPASPPLTITRNVGESVTYGAEIEGRYDFENGLQLYGALGLLDTEFKDFDDDACAPSGGSCAGNSFPESPAVTASLGGIYRHDSGFFISANGNYTSDYYTLGDVNNQSALEVNGRFLANSRVGYEMENLSASVFVDNVFDEEYLTGRSLFADEGTAGDGRTYGVELRVFF